MRAFGTKVAEGTPLFRRIKAAAKSDFPVDKKIKTYLKKKTLTPFQEKALLAVATIPEGQVRSYKWVAEKIGCPNAFRAVGQSLKRNPFPVAVPCHRVVKSDYRLGGFSCGRRRKIELLSKEGLTVKNGVVIINEGTTYGGRSGANKGKGRPGRGEE